jgi:hypothetical protein
LKDAVNESSKTALKEKEKWHMNLFI